MTLWILCLYNYGYSVFTIVDTLSLQLWILCLYPWKSGKSDISLRGEGLTARRGQGPGDFRCICLGASDLSGYERTPSPWCCARYRAGWEGWWHWPGLAVRWDCPSSITQIWNFEFDFSLCMYAPPRPPPPPISHLGEPGQTPRRLRMPISPVPTNEAPVMWKVIFTRYFWRVLWMI